MQIWNKMPAEKPNPPTKNKATKVNYRKYLTPLILVINGMLILADVVMLTLLPRQTKEIVVARSEIVAHQLQAQSTQKLVADLTATQKEQERIEKALPDEDRLLEVIQVLESIKGVSPLKSFSFSSDKPVKDKSGLGFLPLALAFEGSLPDTMVVFAQLEKLPYLFVVDSARTESPNGISGATSTQVSLRLYVNEPFTKD